MRIAECLQLNKCSESLNSFFGDRTPLDVFSSLDDAGDFSLQEESLRADDFVFERISFALRVIASIAARPHLSTKREEIVTRVEKAKQISPDDFGRVCRDSSLWKRRKAVMIPENIYYFQHTDELAIYENRFVVMLIDEIDKELSRYVDFYTKILPSIDDGACSLDAIKLSQKFCSTDRLRREVDFIKETNFYKTVGKEKRLRGKVKPTNILIKDPKYRECYKFYDDFVKYKVTDSQKDEISFYKLLTLKALKTLGFSLKNKAKAWEFVGCGFDLKANFDNAVTITVTDKKSGVTQSSTLGIGQGDEYIGVWNIYSGDETLFASGLSEYRLMLEWFKRKLRIVPTDGDAYKKFCPVCKAASLGGDTKVVCRRCRSQFVFTEREGRKVIWLCKHGRGR